jgi:hypothetical protein
VGGVDIAERIADAGAGMQVDEAGIAGSLRVTGSSVEPGLPNTRLMPNARKRPKVASLTVSAALAALADLRDDIGRRLLSGFSCVPPSLLGEDGSYQRLKGLLHEVKPARENK